MQARGLLMIEHRLIERMLAVIKEALAEIESKQRIDPVFVDTAVDFVRVYADRTHHGKEEDLLFRELAGRPLTEADRAVMNELVAEHVQGRQATQRLIDANARYRSGDAAALGDIARELRVLVDFYPRHIEKEDKAFFPASRTYFTDEEDEAMVAAFAEFDRRMVHEKYEALVLALEKAR